jgi:hypothetical protein
VTEPTDTDWDQLTLDLSKRVAAFAPDWTDPQSGDPGITIVELLAFVTESLLTRTDATPEVAARLRHVAAELERIAASRCSDGTLTRPRYFYGKVMTPQDFEEEQDYVRTKHRRHNRLLHGVGIVSGFGVSLGTEDGELVIVVSPGLAIDPTGEELVVCERVTVRLCPEETARYVTVGLVERPVDPVPAPAGPGAAGSETEASRIEESAEVAVVDDVPADRLVVARLIRDGDAADIDASFAPARVRR